MKLRIRGNSIRLRLLRSEVALLVREGAIEDSINFGPNSEQTLTYSIRAAIEVIDIAARYESNRITVAVPAVMLKEWAATNEISLHATQLVDESMQLDILIEKDFKCLEREDTDNADAHDRPSEFLPNC